MYQMIAGELRDPAAFFQVNPVELDSAVQISCRELCGDGHACPDSRGLAGTLAAFLSGKTQENAISPRIFGKNFAQLSAIDRRSYLSN